MVMETNKNYEINKSDTRNRETVGRREGNV